MTEESKKIKIRTKRIEGHKREYSNYVEISVNPRDVSLKFCDLVPPARKEQIDKAIKEGIELPVNTEIVLPFDIAESLVEILRKQLNTVNKIEKKEKKA